MEPHKHCHFCGTIYGIDARGAKKWPRACEACGGRVWRNPIPVVVCLIADDDGLLVVRRDIEPGKGELAFPGGYIDLGERWQQAAAREVAEETSDLFRFDPMFFQLLEVEKALNGNLLIFCTLRHQVSLDQQLIKQFTPNPEVSELGVINGPMKLAWDTHTKWAKNYFTGESWPT